MISFDNGTVTRPPDSSEQPPEAGHSWWQRIRLVYLLAVGIVGALSFTAAWLWPRSATEPPSAEPALYALRIQVLDPDGQPVGGATVRTSTGNEPQLLPDGWWEVEIPATKVPADRKVTVWAEHAGWEGGRTDLELGGDPYPRAEVRLKAADSAPPTVLPAAERSRRSPPPIYALRVQILDSDGQPVEGSTVRVSVGNELQLLPDGWWEVEIAAAKLPQGRTVTIWAQHISGSGRKTLTLGDDPNPTIEVALKARIRDHAPISIEVYNADEIPISKYTFPNPSNYEIVQENDSTKVIIRLERQE